MGSKSPSRQLRVEERTATIAPVELGTPLWPRKGFTRDISASGMFIETDATHRIESSITFTVELDTPQGKMVLRCQGEVVRVEPRSRKVGIAVKITNSELVVASIAGLHTAAGEAATSQTPAE